MAISFPPIPVYPVAIDSDSTLFLVYNTSETQLSSNNQPWSDEISIIPVGDSEPEQWGENGFANISGELFYYDAVSKNAAGKINSLRRCARNLSGSQTQFNPSGTWVRGFVIAEHHNQLVDATLKLEKYIGINSSTDTTTLDYKIRDLLSVPDYTDDHGCADVVFTFVVDESTSNSSVGTVIVFKVVITGSFNSYVLDFGDGNTTTDLEGTHTYAINIPLEPVVIVSNETCEIVQTPFNFANPNEPITSEDERFEIPIPEVPEFPPITIPEIDVPETTLTLPQIVFPCLDIAINPLSIIFVPPNPIPSIISFTEIDIPSIITITPPIPSIISLIDTLSDITLIGIEDITLIGIEDISLIGISDISLIGISDISLIGISDISLIGISDISLIGISDISLIGISDISLIGISDISLIDTLSDISLIDTLSDITLIGIEDISLIGISDISLIGIRDISLIVPTIMVSVVCSSPAPLMALNVDEDTDIILDQKTKVEKTSDEIKIIHNLPMEIELNSENIPESIKIDSSDIPGVIDLKLDNNFPSVLKIDASGIPENIQVTGIPESIELKGIIPDIINISAPEDLEIPLVYRGGPIPIKFDETAFKNEDGEDFPCFAIVPCPPKK
jgi:hypothetical protein